MRERINASGDDPEIEKIMNVKIIFALLAGFNFGIIFLNIPPALPAVWFASLNFGALFELVSRTVNSASLATAFGFVNFLANLGAVLFTLGFGLAKDFTGTFFGGFLIMAFAAAIAYFFGKDVLRREKNLKP